MCKYKPHDIPLGTGIVEVTGCEMAWNQYPGSEPEIRAKIVDAIRIALKEINVKFVPGAMLRAEAEVIEREML